ncbi:epoxide hydrolase 1 [Nephila pilipes]|uniref:microsomal epoxide hydrolase n=1 Tax=Nephila pilipes TaxID=299642 RepID=A0A8X6NE75_NEPPI|nr:epoxide hydrolase 1 [Nephila pilipes]
MKSTPSSRHNKFVPPINSGIKAFVASYPLKTICNPLKFSVIGEILPYLKMIPGLSIVAIAIYNMLKFVYNLFFGKPEKDLSGYEEGWYGKGPRPKEGVQDTSIHPFKIYIPDEVLFDLKERLLNARYEPPLEDSKFCYGFNSDYLKSVIEYWKNEYDWRKEEEHLNKFSHFKTCIEGIDVHFVHVKPTVPEGRQLKVLPLLVVHGWPGSFYEFYKIIPLLTAPSPDRDFVFEVVCPSIPGYGFSSAPCKKGFDATATSRLFITLMDRLGHNRFFVQGGDWGSFIATLLGKYYPSSIIGVHVNMYSSGPKSWDFFKAIAIAYFPSLVSPAEYKGLYPFWERFKTILQETGYLHIQATKPDTVGSGLADSPVGLAAYILEKFSTWTDMKNRESDKGNLIEKFTLDELLTNVMIYWVNNNITSSVRFYKENIGNRAHEKMSLTVPCGFALFPNELVALPRCLMERSITQLLSYTVMPRGGHFAAFEEPQLLADDIWNFVSLVQKMK